MCLGGWDFRNDECSIIMGRPIWGAGLNDHLDQGFLTGGKFPPWGKYGEFRGEMRAFENCCLFKTGDTKWFP